jgi:prophage maintenance system killer protein
LIDGSKRLGLEAVIVFYGLNGEPTTAATKPHQAISSQVRDAELP